MWALEDAGGNAAPTTCQALEEKRREGNGKKKETSRGPKEPEKKTETRMTKSGPTREWQRSRGGRKKEGSQEKRGEGRMSAPAQANGLQKIQKRGIGEKGRARENERGKRISDMPVGICSPKKNT